MNYFRAITQNDVSEEVALSNLKCLSQAGLFAKAFVSSPKFQEFFARLKDTTQLEDPVFFNKNTEILINLVNAIASYNSLGDNSLSDDFHKIPQEEILMPFVQIVEDQNEGYVEKSLEFLNAYFEVQRNKNLFAQRGFHFAVHNIAKQEDENQNKATLLLGKIMADT